MGFDLFDLVVRLPALLVGLTFHEFAHAFASDRLGDPTPRSEGRLSLNPLAHLDPIGTICLFIGPIGWAKPVPVNPSFWRNRHAEYYVSLAGVTMNLLLAAIVSLIVRFIFAMNVAIGPAVAQMLYYGVFLNLGLMVFNLLPIYPLDGSHVMRELLPYRYRAGFDRFSRYAPFVLLAFLLMDRRIPFLSEIIHFFGRLLLSDTVWGQLWVAMDPRYAA